MEQEELTGRIIECAIEVHRHLGPGLLEAAYETALDIEFQSRGFERQRQVSFSAWYKGQVVGNFFADFLVEGRVIVEIKSVRKLEAMYESQMFTYLRLSGCRVGLLLNFFERTLATGIRRVVWSPPADTEAA